MIEPAISLLRSEVMIASLEKFRPSQIPSDTRHTAQMDIIADYADLDQNTEAPANTTIASGTCTD